MVLIPLLGKSQDLVFFQLQPNGTFLTSSGQDFAVVSYEGKNSEEIYKQLSTNIGIVFNNPDKVMSGVEYSFIKVRTIIPISEKIEKIIMMGNVKIEVDGYLQYDIKIKDGRVRISAPYIENDVWIDGGASGTYSNIINSWFKPEKKGKEKIGK